MTRATLIYNPVAGRNPARRIGQIRLVSDILRQTGFELDVIPTAGPGAARDLARSAADAGAEAVIVCGGDGTVNEAVNGLAGSHCPLAILPGGTTNVAAKDLGLPRSLLGAARDLERACPRRVALGRVAWQRSAGSHPVSAPKAGFFFGQDSRYFLSIAGVGFDAYVIHCLTRDFAAGFGVAAYVWEAFYQIWRYRFPSFTCRSRTREWRGTLAVFQRTELYAGWLRLAPGATVLNDEMSLCLFEGRRPWRYFLYAAAVALQRQGALGDVRIAQESPVACLSEDSSTPIYVELDGELAGELPATFELVPDALTLLLPQLSAEALTATTAPASCPSG